jgi:hypothetical protein
MAANLKMTVLWEVSPYSLAEIFDVSQVFTAFIFRVMMFVGQLERKRPLGDLVYLTVLDRII